MVDVAVYAPVPMQPGLTTTLHTSGVGDLTYLPTIGYVIPENEATHTVIAATAYVTGPSGSYDASRLVNIGDNRWRIQPQIGISQRFLKVATVDLIGNLAFYTKNSAFPTPQGFVSMTQNQTFGLEAHAAVDLSPDFYLSASYYLAAIGETDVQSPPALPLSTYQPAATVQSVRFSFGIRAEKATLLLLQYNQDVSASGDATISRFIGARLSHAIFF